MHYSDLIQLYFERSNALQWYWTLYVVVVGGLLAFSSLRVRRDPITGVLVTVLFCFFAYKNLGAIGDVIGQRESALQAIHKFPVVLDGPDPRTDAQVRETLEPTLITTPFEGVRKFHLASDALTIAALWAMELRRMRNARSELAK